jgi:hypothetical protein
MATTGLAMLRPHSAAATLALLISGDWSEPCRAQAVVLESGTLGATGQLSGASVTIAQFVGWRFALDAPLVIGRIGGHMLNNDLPGGVFAALVALPSLEAFPQGDPFTDHEVLATTVFDPPLPNNEVRTPLHAALIPGVYALVFGTGLFGATGEAALPNTFDQNDVPPTNISSFIFYGLTGPGSPQVWRTNLASHIRIVIEGHEPIAADFDDDGQVDAADLALWETGFGAAIAALHNQGDANADVASDGADFLV